MPSSKRQRGVRAKRNKKQQQHKQLFTRSAAADQLRLEKAIERSTNLNSARVSQQALTGASSSITPPADEQERPTPAGVIQVSLDSDSDQALSPSEEGPLPEEEPASPTSPQSAICADYTKPRKEATQSLDRPDDPCTLPSLGLDQEVCQSLRFPCTPWPPGDSIKISSMLY